MKPSSKRSATSRAPAEPVVVRRLTLRQRAAWLDMRAALYGEQYREQLDAEIPGEFARDDFVAFGAKATSGWVGLIEMGSRPYAEGCATSPVGYVEGLWVAAGFRRQGVARSLVEAGIRWAKARGYAELASDAEIGNLVSHKAHRRLGFSEVERIVCFRMPLD